MKSFTICVRVRVCVKSGTPHITPVVSDQFSLFSMPRALVTAGTGFLAHHLIQQLLEKNWEVTATYRGNDSSPKLAWLKHQAQTSSKGSLRLIQRELTNVEVLIDAFEGHAIIFHTAAAVQLGASDVFSEMIDPALEMTRAVFQASVQTASVRKLIFTSSDSAVVENPPLDRVLTESDWNETSTPTHNPYKYMKTVTERELWKLYDAWLESEKENSTRECALDVIAINPGLIIGPFLNAATHGQLSSLDVICKLMRGDMKHGVPNLVFPSTDVNDVVQTHLAAAENSQASGRYLVVSEGVSYPQMAQLLRQHFPAYHAFIPTRTLPSLLVETAAKVWGPAAASGNSALLPWSIMRTWLDSKPQFSQQKVSEELLHRPLQSCDTALIACANSLIACGAVPERRCERSYRLEDYRVWPIHVPAGKNHPEIVTIREHGLIRLHCQVTVEADTCPIEIESGSLEENDWKVLVPKEWIHGGGWEATMTVQAPTSLRVTFYNSHSWVTSKAIQWSCVLQAEQGL